VEVSVVLSLKGRDIPAYDPVCALVTAMENHADEESVSMAQSLELLLQCLAAPKCADDSYRF
jgi:hypothetical protein